MGLIIFLLLNTWLLPFFFFFGMINNCTLIFAYNSITFGEVLWRNYWV